MASKITSQKRTHLIVIGLCAIGIALLAIVFAMARSAAADGEHEYAGQLKCKTCHKKNEIGDQYGKWLESKHAKAFETLATEKSKKWAAEAGISDPQSDERCVKCHVTAHGVSAERLPKKFDRSDGVQCEACHGPGKDYRKKKIMIDRDKALANGLVIPTEELCVKCHNDESPAWDPERYTLADGKKVGFDFEQAKKAIAHPVPEGYDPLAEGEAD